MVYLAPYIIYASTNVQAALHHDTLRAIITKKMLCTVAYFGVNSW